MFLASAGLLPRLIRSREIQKNVHSRTVSVRILTYGIGQGLKVACMQILGTWRPETWGKEACMPASCVQIWAAVISTVRAWPVRRHSRHRESRITNIDSGPRTPPISRDKSTKAQKHQEKHQEAQSVSMASTRRAGVFCLLSITLLALAPSTTGHITVSLQLKLKQWTSKPEYDVTNAAYA